MAGLVHLSGVPTQGTPFGIDEAAPAFGNIPTQGNPIGFYQFPQEESTFTVRGDTGDTVLNVNSVQFTYDPNQLSGVINVTRGRDGVAIVRVPVIRVTQACPCGGTGGGGGDLDGGTP